MMIKIEKQVEELSDNAIVWGNRVLAAIFLSLLVLPLHGCGPRVRVHTGPGDPGTHSVIEFDKALYLLKLDEVEFESRHKGVGVRYDIVNIAPGRHSFGVVYFDTKTVPDPPMILDFDIEPNRKYRIILDISQGLGKKAAAVIAEDTATGEWLAESPSGIPKAYIVKSTNSITAEIHVKEAPELRLPSTKLRFVSEIHSSNGTTIYRSESLDLRNHISKEDGSQHELTFDAEKIAYRETLLPGGKITLKKVTEVQKDASGTYRAVGFIATAASDIQFAGEGGNRIPEGAALRVVFGRILAVE
jgi:hypothetical protein